MITKTRAPYFTGFAFLVLFTTLIFGCGGDGDPFKIEDKPNMETEPNDSLTFIALEGGELIAENIRITNTGEATLVIDGIELIYDGQSPAEVENGDAFQLELLGAGLPVNVETSGANGEFNFELHYTHYDDGLSRTATLIIRSNDRLNPVKEIAIDVLEGKPVLDVIPAEVFFDDVKKDEVTSQTVTFLNKGSIDLRIHQILVLGHEAFRVSKGDASATSNETLDFDPPITIPNGESTQVNVEFAPLGREEATGRMVIMTNDPTLPSGKEIFISGNTNMPCLEITPKNEINFNGRLIGHIAQLPVILSNCGNAEVSVSGISMLEGASPDFAFDFSELSTGTSPDADNPLLIDVNGSETFYVQYIPDEENPIDEITGAFLYDTGTLVVENNSFEEEISLDLQGFGVTELCPTAIIDVLEGDQVIPQTVLHLKSNNSYAPAGEVVEFYWEVLQPVGSESVFIPSPTWPNPTFTTNVAGNYRFYLDVYDQDNTISCETAEYLVTVIPDEAIHVELLWDTPNDFIQSDEGPAAGSDMDLHFIHPYAGGGPDKDFDGVPDPWFDPIYDCAWFNRYPDWASIDPNVDDNPGLDRDDTDGAGPENLNLAEPEDVIYRVGVHYFDDNAFGLSIPTIRVYVFTALLLEITGPEMLPLQMWEAAEIDWPIIEARPVIGPIDGFKIIDNYEAPIQ
ncbi:MAG: hypothetical protein CMH54_01590 [Myxococcales bacterium]|nr:hypothetical protein [Myxococcales bacterium]